MVVGDFAYAFDPEHGRFPTEDDLLAVGLMRIQDAAHPRIPTECRRFFLGRYNGVVRRCYNLKAEGTAKQDQCYR